MVFHCVPVALNEGQGHANCYKIVKILGDYDHSYFERSQSLNVHTQASVNSIYDFFLYHGIT